MNQDQIMRDMRVLFDYQMHEIWTVENDPVREHDLAVGHPVETNGCLRWMPDQLISSEELVHQIEVK